MDAAWDLLRSDGFDSISLRRVAGALDVTAPALYAHIDGKDDLLGAIAAFEFRDLSERTDPAGAATISDAVDRVVRGYVEYSVERPHAFHLLFRLHSDLAGDDGARHAQAVAMFDRASAAIRAAVASGELPQADAETTSFAIWSLAHGIASGLRLGYGQADAAQVVTDSVATFVAGLRAG